MPDITMCNFEECKSKKTCYRYLAIPEKHYQSYFILDYKDQEKAIEDKCAMYWDVEVSHGS